MGERSVIGAGACSTVRWMLVMVLLASILLGCGRSNVVRREPEPPSPPVARAVPASGEYRVVRGDTLYGIAFRHGLDYRDVARWNRIGPPYTIYPGQMLWLRPGTRVAVEPAPTTRPPARQPPPAQQTPPPQQRPVSPPTQRSAPPAQDRPHAQSSHPSPPPPAPSVGGAIAWRWPTEGQIVTRFVAGDPTRQGLDIAGRDGQAVRATADGVVVYSGAGLVGYGELIIVKHSDEWLSAYGHNRRRLAAEGEQVKAGQQIAEMGRTGASRDMLHFEIRRNGKPVDPLPLLPPR